MDRADLPVPPAVGNRQTADVRLQHPPAAGRRMHGGHSHLLPLPPTHPPVVAGSCATRRTTATLIMRVCSDGCGGARASSRRASDGRGSSRAAAGSPQHLSPPVAARRRHRHPEWTHRSSAGHRTPGTVSVPHTRVSRHRGTPFCKLRDMCRRVAVARTGTAARAQMILDMDPAGIRMSFMPTGVPRPNLGVPAQSKHSVPTAVCQTFDDLKRDPCLMTRGRSSAAAPYRRGVVDPAQRMITASPTPPVVRQSPNDTTW